MKNKLEGKSDNWVVTILPFLLILLGLIYFNITGQKLIAENETRFSSEDKSAYDEYSSFNDMVAKSNMSIVCPEYVKSLQDVKFMGYNNQIIEISNDNMCFKAAYFVNNLADNMGIYDDCDIDCRYTLKNSAEYDSDNVLFVRYRSGFKEYPGKAILNWNDGQIQYSLMVDDTGLEDVVNKADIDISYYDIIENQEETLESLEIDESKKWDDPVICKANGSDIVINMPKDTNSYVANFVKLINDGWELDILAGSDLIIIISNTNFEGSSIPTAVSGVNLFYSDKVIEAYGLDSSDMVRIAASLRLEEEHNEDS